MYTLSRRAQQDRIRLIEDLAADRNAGVAVARYVDGIIEDYLLRIAAKLIPGHPRQDIKIRRSLLFCTAEPTKYVIAFDPESRKIVRILHGRRELARIIRD